MFGGSSGEVRMLASEAILVMVRFRCWYQKLLVVWIISKSEGFMDRGVCGSRRVMLILSRRIVN